MTPAELDLARELVSRPWWEWRPGMRAVSSDRVWTSAGALPDPDLEYRCWAVESDPDVIWWVDFHGDIRDGRQEYQIAWCVPDLCDPATQGCLLAMLNEGTSADVRLTWANNVDGVPGRSLEARWMGWTWRGDPAQILARALLAVRT